MILGMHLGRIAPGSHVIQHAESSRNVLGLYLFQAFSDGVVTLASSTKTDGLGSTDPISGWKEGLLRTSSVSRYEFRWNFFLHDRPSLRGACR